MVAGHRDLDLDILRTPPDLEEDLDPLVDHLVLEADLALGGLDLEDLDILLAAEGPDLEEVDSEESLVQEEAFD